MTIEQLSTLHQARPFLPFTLCLADGNGIRVEHSEFLARTPGGRTVIVTEQDESFRVIDLLLVTNLAVGNGRSHRGRKS